MIVIRDIWLFIAGITLTILGCLSVAEGSFAGFVSGCGTALGILGLLTANHFSETTTNKEAASAAPEGADR